MRAHRLILVTISVALSASVFVVSARDSDAPRARSVNAPKPPSPTATASPSGDCCIEAVQTNYPIPPRSARGNHCPSDRVPHGSSNLFDPESGRLEIDFYDVGYGHSRSFVLDLRDPACLEEAATRQALFIELVVYMDTAGDYAGTCRKLRDAIRAGSLKLGEVPFDLRPARPHIDEVCPTVHSSS